MNRRLVLTLAVLFTFAAILGFYFRQRQASFPAAAVPELLLLAPADADSIVYVDLAALRSSPFLNQLLALAPSPNVDAEYREFVSSTGFDYSRDLDRVLISTPSARGPNALYTAIAEGQFDRAKLAAYSLRSGKLEKQNGAEVYLVSSGRPAKTLAYTFLSPGRILLANASTLDPSAVRRAQNLPPDQYDRFLRVAGSALIVIGRVDASQQNFSVFGFRSPDLQRALRDIRWFSLGARPDGNRMRVALEAECITAEAARELAATAEALRLVARVYLSDPRSRRQMSPQAAALLEVILRNGEFIQKGQRVLLRFDLAAESFALPPSSGAAPSAPGKIQ